MTAEPIGKLKVMLKYLQMFLFALLAISPSAQQPRDSMVLHQETGTEISSAIFSPNGRWLLLTGEGGSELWDLKGAEPSRMWSNPNGGGSASFNSESTKFAVMEYANLTHPHGQALSVWSILNLASPWRPPNNRFSEPAIVRFGAKNGSIFVADGTRKAWLLDPANGPMVALPVNDAVADASFSRTGELLGIATQHGISVLRAPFSSVGNVKTLPRDFTSRISFSFDDKWMATTGDDETIRIWDTSTWKVVKEIPGRQTSALHFFHHSNCLVASDSGDHVAVWDIEKGEAVFTLQVPFAYDITPTDTFLATAEPQSVLLRLRDISGIKARCEKIMSR
jgi:WD40 repeat protein